jgi:RNA-directed DNA polymerase
LGIPTIQDRAKQALAKLALEPEWEARFEPNSYGFRPGRGCHDAIEAIYGHLRHGADKLVYDADIRKCFDRIDHAALLQKLHTFPLMEQQVQAWLQAGIMEEFAETPPESVIGGVISPLLANIALHGLEEHLKSMVSARTSLKPDPDAARKQKALGVIRYADNFVIIHRNPKIMELVIQETKVWLTSMGLEISEEKSKLRWASQSFVFRGFQIILVKRNGKIRVKITPSKDSVKGLSEKTRSIIQANKSASSYSLIFFLRPVLIDWANYYRYCECKETFKQVDNIVYQQLRAWVLRRAVRKGRIETMEKYFRRNREYKFQNRTYQANWIFSGNRVSKRGIPVNAYLPKISWVSSKSFVKIKERSSVYHGDHLYWSKRNPCPPESTIFSAVKTESAHVTTVPIYQFAITTPRLPHAEDSRRSFEITIPG